VICSPSISTQKPYQANRMNDSGRNLGGIVWGKVMCQACAPLANALHGIERVLPVGETRCGKIDHTMANVGGPPLKIMVCCECSLKYRNR